MTLTPTHLSLTSILFWTFIPASEREKFHERKLYFWGVVAFSLLPDLDIFIGLHRGLAHSVILPMLMIIFGALVYSNYQYLIHPSLDEQNSKETLDNRSFLGRCIIYAAILWLIHISLDLDYPIAIFYPLSDRLYQFNFVILYNLMPWFIFPATIAGIGFKISGLSYLKGLTTYFVNLPPSIREEIYGREPISFSIDDFFLHVIIFLIFLVFIARPMAPTINLNRFFEWRKKVHFDGPILGFGLVMIMIGFLIGPMIGTHTIDTDSLRSSFQISSTIFSPSIALKFETTNYLFQPSTVFSVNSVLTTSSNDNPFDQVLLLTTQDAYSNFSSRLSKLYKQSTLNTTESLLAFETSYGSLFDDFITYPLALNLTNQNKTSLNTQIYGGSFAIVGLIENWNSTLILNGSLLKENIRLEVTITSNRFTLLAFGITSMILGTGVLALSARIKKR
ncbi:MAG: metal-dependent hydrolase [Promethearchaeota archaeon]